MPVDGDPTRLEQVITNLLDNAIKYTPAGGTVTLEVAGEGDQAVLRVRDDGIGIAPDLLPRLFEPFVQAESSLDRARGGLGLGLAVVKRLVELHGGSVAATSAGVGQGSEFTVRLPRSPVPAPPPPPAAAPPPPTGALSIAIIEDNRDAREGLRLLLEAMGHRVEVADTGPAGLELLRTHRPDVAFIDLGLPGLDGFGVARAVRKIGAIVDTYLVAVTGYGQSADRQRAAEAGFDAHLVKPVDAAAGPRHDPSDAAIARAPRLPWPPRRGGRRASAGHASSVRVASVPPSSASSGALDSRCSPPFTSVSVTSGLARASARRHEVVQGTSASAAPWRSRTGQARGIGARRRRWRRPSSTRRQVKGSGGP